MGDILSAFCTCTAGLGGTCNHVAAVLFRVEAAVKQGFTSPSCTTLPCTWTIPGKKAPLQLKPVVDMEWKQDRYGKQRKRPLVIPKRKLFSPVEAKYDSSVDVKFATLSIALKDVLPNAVLHAATPKPEEPKRRAAQEPTSLPDGLLLKPLLKSGCTSLSQEQVDAIEIHTRGQNVNPQWTRAREGRITASIMHRIHTRMNTLKTKPDTSVESLLSSFLDPADLGDISSIKHGVNMESEAIDSYVAIMKAKHDNFETRKCGLFVDCEKPYIGASPDLVVECSCCGKGLLEVKCPYSASHTVPQAGTPDYLIVDENKTALKKNHTYHTQVIGQLGVSKREWCDFFVYTSHGHFLQRIHSDMPKWESIRSNIDLFFNKFVSPKLM